MFSQLFKSTLFYLLVGAILVGVFALSDNPLVRASCFVLGVILVGGSIYIGFRDSSRFLLDALRNESDQ